MPRPITVALLAATVLSAQTAEARLVRLHVVRREVVLGGRPFGLAGPYEKLVGTAYFALDPDLPQNRIVVDLHLATRNAGGAVEFSADFYLLKPVDPATRSASGAARACSSPSRRRRVQTTRSAKPSSVTAG